MKKTSGAPRWAFALAAASIGATATAQPATSAQYRNALRRGEDAHSAGRHEEALRIFRGLRAGAGEPTMELLGFLAQEEIETGELAGGIRDATECVRRVDLVPGSEAARTVARQCLALLDAIRTQVFGPADVPVAMVRWSPPPRVAPGLTLRVNNQEIPRRFWNRPYPVHAGDVPVEVSLPDTGTVRMTVHARAGSSLVVQLPEVSADTGVTVETTPSVVTESEPPPSRRSLSETHASTEPPPPPSPPRPRRVRTETHVTGAVYVSAFGAVVTLASVPFYVFSAQRQSTLDERCPTRRACDPWLTDLADDGRTLRTIGNSLLITGAVVTTVGLVWGLVGGFTSTSRIERRPRAPALSFGVSPTSLTLSGNF